LAKCGYVSHKKFALIEDHGLKSLKDKISSFISYFEGKYDKHHVLFLFQMYNYSDGVRDLCEKLSLKQELLSFYMQNEDNPKILEVCCKHGDTDTDMWIQALTFYATRSNSGENIRIALEEIDKREF